jgi:hypothetical protein
LAGVEYTADERTRAKQWLRARLTEGDRPRQEWRELWAAGWEHLIRMPVEELVDRRALADLADRLADSQLLVEVPGPLLHRVVRAAIESLRANDEPVQRLMPDEARQRLREAVARPGLVHPDWVRATLRGEAVEAVLNDLLYQVLKDFSTLIPRMMTKMPTIGRFSLIGGAGALAERLIREVEKMVEPEIRAFLADSTGRVLESAAEFTIARIDDPAQLEFRATFVDFVLSRSPAFLLLNVDEPLTEDLELAVGATLRHLSEDPEARATLRDWIERGMQYCEGKTVAEVLELDEGSPAPPVDALADASWPAFRSLIESAYAQGWLDGLVDELLDFLAR